MNRDQKNAIFAKYNAESERQNPDQPQQAQEGLAGEGSAKIDSPQEPAGGADETPQANGQDSSQEGSPDPKSHTGQDDSQQAPTHTDGEGEGDKSEGNNQEFSFDIETDPQNPFSTQQTTAPGSSIESVDQLLNLPLSDELKDKLQQQLQEQSPKQAGPFEGISEQTAAAIQGALQSGAIRENELEHGFDPRTGHVARLIIDGENATKEYAATFFRREAVSRGYQGKEVDEYVQESLENHEDSLSRFARKEAEDQDRRTKELVESYRSERASAQENMRLAKERQERERAEYQENVLRTLRGMEQIPGTTTKMEQGLKARIYESAINPDKLAQSIKQGLGDSAKAPQIIRALSMMFDGQRVIRDLQTAAAADAKRSMVDRGRSPMGRNGTIPTKHGDSPSTQDQYLDFIMRKTQPHKRQ